VKFFQDRFTNPLRDMAAPSVEFFPWAGIIAIPCPARNRKDNNQPPEVSRLSGQ
jgi:hypothetical protein